MKKIVVLLMVISAQQTSAQQQSGRVVYEFTRQMQLRVMTMGGGGEQTVPKIHTEKIEVLFANNCSLRRRVQEDLPDDFAAGSGRMDIAIGGGADDLWWYNFMDGRSVQQREFATKEYLISDTIQKLNWKISGLSKNILGYACQQAITTRIGKRREMRMENGQLTQKEVADTASIVAWFATAIPVAAGPEFQGQLPGLILEVETNGMPMYKAIELSAKVDEKLIKEPKKGKKVTAEQFNKERDKVMDEMQRNGPPGMRVMRMN